MLGGVFAGGPDVVPLLILWAGRLGLLVLLAAICWSDIRFRRIPNRLILAGLCAVLAWQSFALPGAGLFQDAGPGALGIGESLAGMAAAFTAFLVLHLMRMMGAGDVKLMALLGAAFGLHALPALLISVFLAGGALAAVRLVDGPRRRAVFSNLRIILYGSLARASLGGDAGPQFDPRTDSADRLPFALAISAGALLLAGLQLAGKIG